jgi:selenocysteine lyase/cysteine desulfurase
MVENRTSLLREDDAVYFNNAGQARLARVVEAAGMEAIRNQSRPHRNTGTEDQRRIRELFARLIDAEAKNIAIMPSTAFAITLAARNIVEEQLEWKSGKILVLQDQMCSAVYPWQDVCDRSKGQITLDIVPYPNDDSNWTEGVLDRIDRDGGVLAACLPPLHWSDGALVDLERIGGACRARGIPLVVDATQAVGALPCSVRSVRPAMLACSVHKWLRAPSGASLVYVAPELHSLWKPLDQHGRSRDVTGSTGWEASKNEMGPAGYPEKFFDDARKFDSGGKPHPIVLPMLRASLEQVVERNAEQIQNQLKSLTQPLVDWALSHGFRLAPGGHAFHLIGIRPPFHISPEQMTSVCSHLQERGIYIAVRCGAFRISPYVDNTQDDVERLIEALNEVLLVG